jgi:hypothetical protein
MQGRAIRVPLTRHPSARVATNKPTGSGSTRPSPAHFCRRICENAESGHAVTSLATHPPVLSPTRLRGVGSTRPSPAHFCRRICENAGSGHAVTSLATHPPVLSPTRLRGMDSTRPSPDHFCRRICENAGSGHSGSSHSPLFRPCCHQHAYGEWVPRRRPQGRRHSTVADATAFNWASNRGMNPTANMKCPYGTGEPGTDTRFQIPICRQGPGLQRRFPVITSVIPVLGYESPRPA